MSGKWLELLKEVAPQVERAGLMVYPETAASIGFFKFAEALAPALKVKLVALGVHDADEIKRILTAFAAEGNGGLVVTPHAVTFTNRLFSHISIDWAGRPLRSLGAMLALIRGTTTKAGLKVEARLDQEVYRKGRKVTERQLKQLALFGTCRTCRHGHLYLRAHLSS